MATIKSIAAALDAIATRFPSRTAVISPFQKVGNQSITYEELREKTNSLAGFLTAYGYEKADILVSDLPNVPENLILQIACNRIGVHYATAKDLDSMAKFPKVRGAVSATASGFLAETNLPFPYLSGEFLLDMIHNNGLDTYHFEEFDNNVNGQDLQTHAFYNSTTPFTNQQALELGSHAAEELTMIEDDKVCISITLCHAFGMGSAVCSALYTGATIVLPAVGGIQGCGIPSERAEATFQVLESEQCTLLFADSHTLKALPDKPERLNLRGGVCKIGSGSTFLEETRKYGGVTLKTLGSPK